VPGVVQQPSDPSETVGNWEPSAAEVDELRAWLRAQGVSEDDLARAASGSCAGEAMELSRHAVELVFRRDAGLSIRDIGHRSGVEPERIARVFRAFGVAVPDLDAPDFTEDDAELVGVAFEAGAVDSPDGLVLARAVATALDRMAHAAVAFYVQGTEAELLRRGAPPLVLAQKTMHATELAGRLGVALGVLFRHHMRQAVEGQRISQNAASSRDVAWIAIGFVDLVDSTALGQRLDLSDLRKLVSEFEAQAFEVASQHGGRLVKFIGDEIMVAALDPAAGCRLVTALVETCTTGGMQPRGGMSWGEVLYRGGDYYGREVNLASRLVDAAIPGEVLVDTAVVAAVEGEAAVAGRASTLPDLRFERAGRRVLKGFADPIEVWSVMPATAHDAPNTLGRPTGPV